MQAPANRQLHIQGLRAIAVLLVIAYHAGLPVSGGFIGVDVFFVISGYVITAMLERELAASGRIRFGRFYLRRFKRLTPALALTVTATCIGAGLVLSPFGPQQQAARTAIGAMFLAANAVIASTTGGYFDAPAATNPLLNIWSLSVEEQFYLFFPLLMVGAWTWAARRGKRSHVSAIVAGVGLVSFALAVVGSRGTVGFLVGFYSPFTRAWEFAAGALLALLPQPRWGRQTALVFSSVGAGLLCFAATTINAATPFPGTWTLLPVVATLALITSGGRKGNLIADGLASKFLVQVGDWSYSLYLWHWPAIVLFTTLRPNIPGIGLIAAAASIVPALISYYFVEQPIRARDFVPKTMAVVIAVTIAIPVIAATSLDYTANHVWKPKAQRAVAHFADARALHIGYIKGCHFEPGDGDTDPAPCVWNASASGIPVYLMGDSNAAQFEEALVDATTSADRPFMASTSSGCPLLDVRMDGPDFPGYGASCLARNLRLLQWISRMPHGIVVLAMSDHYWYDAGWSLTAQGVRYTGTAAMLSEVQQSLQRITTALEADGHRVVLVRTIPHWIGKYQWDPTRCTLEQSLHGCVMSMPAAYSLGQRSEAAHVLQRVASSSRVTVLDLTAQICPGGTCRTATSELPVYRDATHITVAMSHRLAPVFETALQ